jgi:spore germination cell wall hydrolase CwlJ-like protein
MKFIISLYFLLLSIFSYANDYDEQTICLAENIYHEARGEIVEGQIAVSNVVINRVKSKQFPNDICSVVYQRNQIEIIDRIFKIFRIPKLCQFSWVCDFKSNSINDSESWKNIQSLAQKIVLGDHDDLTNGATHYYNPKRVPTPQWANVLTKTSEIGNHHFYK